MLFRSSDFPGEYDIAQVCEIFDYVVGKWKYVNDADKGENYRSASRTIANGLTGDCDDFAILIAALVESIGGQTRISMAYNEKSGHAFTEVLVTRKKEEMQRIVDEINKLYKTRKFKIHYKIEQNGECWLNLDWFGTPQHPGGKYFDYNRRTVYYPTIDNPTYVIE